MAINSTKRIEVTKMLDRYIYPAIVSLPEQEGWDYCVVFPDLDVATQGETLQEALDMAKELLELTIYSLEMDGEKIPEATSPEEIKLDKPELFMTLVSVHMPLVRAEMDLQYVKKTVTLPKWLNDLAEEANINFSKTLQAAIKAKLDSSEQPICVHHNLGNKQRHTVK